MGSTVDFRREVLRQNALDNARSQPVYVTKVEVNGGSGFSELFFRKLLAPVAERSDYTLAQLIAHVNQCRAKLSRTGVFLSITPSLHIDYAHTTPTARSYNLDKSLLTKVVFDVDAAEQKLGTATLAFNTEENLTVRMGYCNNNFNCNAELVHIDVDYRPYKPFEHLVLHVRFLSPLRDPSFRFVTELYNAHENTQLWLSDAFKMLTGRMGISYANFQDNFSLFFGLAMGRRSANTTDNDAFPKRGDSVKSSVVSKVCYSTLRHAESALPCGGTSVVLFSEIASDQAPHQSPVNWVKTSAALDAYRSFSNATYTTHVFAEGGAICSAGPARVRRSELFFLGGLGSFPGFAKNGVQVNGATQYYKVGATLYSRLPCAKKIDNDVSPLRCFVTGMVGKVSENVARDSGVFSTGVGLRYFNKWVHLNAGYYLASRLDSDHDIGVRDGFQFEVSIAGANQKDYATI